MLDPVDVGLVIACENLVGRVADFGQRRPRADEVDGVAGREVEFVLGIRLGNDPLDGLEEFQKAVDGVAEGVLGLADGRPFGV